MQRPRPAPSTTSEDTELLERARSGDSSAVGVLYAQHRAGALRLAQLLAGPDAAEDLLADAFSRVVARFRAGGGPTNHFQAYLYTTIRNRHRDLRRVARREEPVSDQPWLLDDLSLPPVEESDHLDDEEIATALATLPESWQRALWLLEVEELTVHDVAEQMELTPAAVSSLAYRAREGLRTAFLDQRTRATPVVTTECGWVRQRLGRFVRAALGEAATGRLEAHLSHCPPCEGLHEHLERVNRRFGHLRHPTAESHPADTQPVDIEQADTDQEARSSGPRGRNCRLSAGQASSISTSMSR